MWNNPALLNRLAAAIVLATLVFVAWVAGRAFLDQHFPFRLVTVNGAVHEDTRLGAMAKVPKLSGGFFSMDLQAVQRDFQQLPWVRRVDVHRLWPGRLVIALEEHRAAAAWNDRATLNEQGEVFSVEPAEGLPRIYAPEGMEKLLIRRFGEFTRAVAPLHMNVEQIVVTARQSWRVRLSGGITVELGRERIEERLARFVTGYPQAMAAVGTFARADMRYPNGFAVKRAPRADSSKGKA